MTRARRISRADGEEGGGLDLEFETLLDALYFEAKREVPEARGMTFVEDDGEETLVTYLAAMEKARARAGALQRAGIERGEPVILVLPTSRDFLYLFFGLLYAGAIPCPLAPPASFADLAELGSRLGAIAQLIGARRLITTAVLRDHLAGAGALAGGDVLLLEDLRREAGAAGPEFIGALTAVTLAIGMLAEFLVTPALVATFRPRFRP